jgi:hypothetical protein
MLERNVGVVIIFVAKDITMDGERTKNGLVIVVNVAILLPNHWGEVMIVATYF